MEEKKEKMTYEEVVNYASQLELRMQKLQQELAKLNYSNAFTRLDFLFKVVENGTYFSSDFLGSVIEEIENTIAIPDVEETEEA